MKISAEGFDYDKKGDIEGLRYNVLLKFRYNKKTKSIFNIEICLKMKYSSDELDAQIFYSKKEHMFTSGTICAKI